jgi:ABC-type branched-subunit amino acid transport system ATPase component
LTTRPADNPFASRRIDRLTYSFPEGGLRSVLERLRRAGGRGAVIGPHGSGKTTLLETLADRLDGRSVWLGLNAETSRPLGFAIAALTESVGPEHTVLIDGAEQLGRWAWWRLTRRVKDAGIVVIASHSPGRFPTIHECLTSPRLLAELVEELAPEMVEETDLDALFRRHHGNIRLCFRELYDLWARRELG